LNPDAMDDSPDVETSAAKTVADCFKYRNKIGIEVAVDALRDFTVVIGAARLNSLDLHGSSG